MISLSRLPFQYGPCRAIGRLLLLLAAGLAGWPAGLVRAQSVDAVGTRARGMAGAFTAVADDASATWWNPAGLPNSLVLDGVIDFQSTELIENRGTPIPEGGAGLRTGAGGLAFAFPALGVSYFRVRQSEVVPATDALDPGREDRGTAWTARSLLTHEFGLSIAQSIGDAVTVGATARVLHGSVGVVRPADGSAVGSALDAAGGATGPGETKADVDVGVMLRASRVRVGLSARNLAEPEFTASDGTSWRLERAARVGVALVSDADRAGRQLWVIALDADLTRSSTAVGDRRDLALGAERWFHARRVGIRGGIRASTAGEARPAASAGASVEVASGIWVETVATGGGDATARGWGVSAHVMF